jgi:DNA-binding MurR/RpiR family transcriptional regulator
MDPNFQKKIYLLRPQLSGQLRKVADFILKDGNHVCFLNSRDLADAANVSSATVVRFSRKLGYDGYQSLKAELQDGVRRQLSSSERVSRTIRSVSGDQILSQIMRQDVGLIESTLQINSEKDFQQAVTKICEARTIYFIGQKSSFALAFFIYYRLCRLGISCKLVTVGGPGVLFSELASLKQNDLLFAVGFQRVSRELQACVKNAAARRARIILITSTSVNFKWDRADVVFLANRGSAELMQSVTAAFSLGHALVVAVAAKLGTRSAAFLNAIDDMEEESLGSETNSGVR